MKPKKYVLVSLSIFIIVVFVLTLFGQQQRPLWNAINELTSRTSALKEDIDVLSGTVSTLQTQLEDANGNINDHESHIALLEDHVATLRATQSEIFRQLNTHTHDYSELTGTLPSHAHDYDSEISGKPTILSEIDVISLIEDYALLKQPDYDSGWTAIAHDSSIDIYHNIGTNNILVYVLGSESGTNPMMHQWAYGGNHFRSEWDVNTYLGEGLIWRCNDEKIWIHRYKSDVQWWEVRVLIWKLD